jgi:hypothetical protein
MNRATTVAVATAASYALVTLGVGFWIFRDDVFMLGAVVFIAVVLAPPCFFVTRNAVRAQQPEPN